jgi:hypothetical protein
MSRRQFGVVAQDFEVPVDPAPVALAVFQRGVYPFPLGRTVRRNISGVFQQPGLKPADNIDVRQMAAGLDLGSDALNQLFPGRAKRLDGEIRRALAKAIENLLRVGNVGSVVQDKRLLLARLYRPVLSEHGAVYHEDCAQQRCSYSSTQ